MPISEFRDQKIDALIKKLVSEYIVRTAERTSLITVTEVLLSKKGETAAIFVSVLPEKEETAALNFLSRHMGEIRTYIGQHAKFSPLPFLTVQIDSGERNRRRIDELLTKQNN